MRRELIAIALALAADASRAGAEVRGLVAADAYVAATPGEGVDAADIAWSAHVEWRDPERAAVLDWVQRESLIGGAPRRELHELSYTDRSIDGLAITAGRFRVPGGFWLIADGAGVALRRGTLELGAFGGSRSFTNGRSETLLTASPRLLPLAGAALTVRGDLQAALSYTYTSDRVELYRGDGAPATRTTPEQFVDAELLAPIGERVLVTAGATAGSRYLVTYPASAARIADDPQLENVWFGSQALYGLVGVRAGRWRLDASAAALRTKLGQAGGDPALASISGSFVESTLRAGWRRERAWRVDMRYRARAWADARHAHRAQIAAAWRRGALDVKASAGVDLHRGARAASGLADGTRLLYRASAGRKTARTELALGAAAVSSLGDELSAGPGADPADARAPYTLEARSYGFVRAFATRGAWFGGVDGEVELGTGAVRALVQIGVSR